MLYPDHTSTYTYIYVQVDFHCWG